VYMFPELSTERFNLEQVEKADQSFIFEGLSHPEVIRYYGVNYDSFAATRLQMDWYEKTYQEGTAIHWKITDKRKRIRMGVISFYYFKPEHKKAELGFWLLPEHWNKGVITEALKPVIQYCQEKKGIHRLEAFVEEGNDRCSHLLEKAGFTLEGTMKDAEVKNGKYISLRIYALLLTTEEYFF
jgi:ribosomal-protein-alanine N-acetyltransferase